MVNTNKIHVKASELIKKHKNNPILTSNDVPYPSNQVYNAGITKYNNKYVMVFRNEYGRTREDYEQHEKEGGPYPTCGTNLGLATSNDGISWTVMPKPCLAIETDEIIRVYDPRLTVIEGKCYMCLAVDTKHGIRGAIAVTDDFDKFEILHMTVPDNRNMVLFPEKINGQFVRLERPFPVYNRRKSEAFDIWLSRSFDCKYWGDHSLLLGAENIPFCNSKIGPAAPPIKTKAGWLTTFHAVWNHGDKKVFKGWENSNWTKEYHAGLMLLALDDPSKIIGIHKEPLLKPEHDYELDGFRGNVIFPGGMILEDSGEVKIYYGAADTVECVATAHVDDLLALCLN